jgi:2-polyprenyl-6-methoxyphenol hydroxylase-like FAD-dependent oxidoreductase
MHVWGVKEARELGVESIMLDAGAHIAPAWKMYMEGVGDAGEIPMGMFVDGVDGTLNLRHPVACHALIDAAAAAGASVVRGVREVKVSVGRSPSASYSCDGDASEIATSLVVGADGRASTIRKQAGITLERQDPVNYIAGLLVDGLDGVPQTDALAGEGDVFFLVFHQGAGRARLYLCPGLTGQHRFAGREGTRKFLDACALSCYPWSDKVTSATPAGPCATYPGDDTWTARPFTEGVVLVGDAAGYNDPVIGQGLSIALRDARIVRDLVLDGARTPDAFATYGVERTERMRRLRFLADVVSVSQAEDANNRLARRAFIGERMARMDPEIMTLLMGGFVGPETVPDELINEGLLDRIRAA